MNHPLRQDKPGSMAHDKNLKFSSKQCKESAIAQPCGEKKENMDVISQLPFLNGYTHTVFGFQIDSSTSRSSITAAIRDTLAQLTSLIPWLGWQVVDTPGNISAGNGFRTVAAWPAESTNDILREKNCDELMPSMSRLLSAGVPVSTLDGHILTPWPGLPQHHGLTGPVPVVALQANFIHGGLLLNLSTHHTIIDATGILQLIRLFANTLEGESIPPDEIAQANRDRGQVIPLIPRGQPVKDHSHLRKPEGYTYVPPKSTQKWCYFNISLLSLSRLMELAGLSKALVSENDMLCAFYWQSLSACRLEKGPAEGYAFETVSKFIRTIDARGVMEIPCTYMGHMIYHATVRLPMGRLVKQPLGEVAVALRRELAASNTPWAVRSYATIMSREPDKSTLLYGGQHNPNTDVGATTSILCAGDARDAGDSFLNHWGPLLGKLKFFRRPNVTPIPGSFTINPVENGVIPLLVCLPQNDLDGLKQNKMWKKYTTYVG